MAKAFEMLSAAGKRYRQMKEAAISGGWEPAERAKKYETDEERTAARREYSKRYRTSERGRASARARRQQASADARAYRDLRAQGRI